MIVSSKFYMFLILLLLLSLFASFSSAAATTSAWDSFLGLSGCHVGDNNPALPLLKSHLRRFGYLPQHSGSANNDDNTFDSDLESAIKTYQQNFHLDPTGRLDLPTISQLTSPHFGLLLYLRPPTLHLPTNQARLAPVQAQPHLRLYLHLRHLHPHLRHRPRLLPRLRPLVCRHRIHLLRSRLS